MLQADARIIRSAHTLTLPPPLPHFLTTLGRRRAYRNRRTRNQRARHATRKQKQRQPTFSEQESGREVIKHNIKERQAVEEVQGTFS